MSKKIIVFIIVILILTGGFFWWWEKQPKEPKTYSEVFEEPIDPNLEPERHKEVYEKVQKIVHFPVMCPKEMPEGYKLVSVEATEGSKIEERKYYGMNTITYEDKEKNKKIQIMEGIADLGIQATGIGIISLNNGKEGWLWKSAEEGLMGVTYSDEKLGIDYIVTGINVSQEEIIEVANFLIETK